MSSPWATSGPLPWSPPALTNPLQVTLDDTMAGRQIKLADGQDCLITAPNILSDWSMVGWQDSLVQVVGGRNVVWIGGHVCAKPGPTTTVTQPMGAGDLILNVKSTAGYEAPKGVIRVDGEAMEYNGVTQASFTITSRNVGFFNASPISSSTTHQVGATVYGGEANRSAVSMQGQTGTVHLEGLQLDGFLCDGIRLSNAPLGVAQIQNCRIGPVTNFDLEYEIDGHPDCLQTYRSGFGTIRVARCSLIAGPNGNCILNQGSGSGQAVGTMDLRDLDIQSPAGFDRSMVVNFDVPTTWTLSNVWMRTPLAQATVKMVDDHANSLPGRLAYAQYAAGQVDGVLAATVGPHYLTPGYSATPVQPVAS